MLITRVYCYQINLLPKKVAVLSLSSADFHLTRKALKFCESGFYDAIKSLKMKNRNQRNVKSTYVRLYGHVIRMDT